MKLELAHDSLAKTIYARASSEDKMLLKKHSFIKRRYEYYMASGVLLDMEGLEYIDPYLEKLSLEKRVVAFIQESRAYIKRRQFIIRGIVLSSALILIIFGIQASRTLYDLNINRNNKKVILAELAQTKQARSVAEQKAQALLNGASTVSAKDLEDMDIVKQMIIQYDTLGKKHLDVSKQRDLAQSATLSDLAIDAWQKNEKDYALQLASKAWELNPENQQAWEIIDKINRENQIAFSEMSTDKQASLVKQSQQSAGVLDDDDFKAIFSKDNIVVKNHRSGVQKSVVNSKSNTGFDDDIGNSKTPVLYQIIQDKLPPPPKPPKPFKGDAIDQTKQKDSNNSTIDEDRSKQTFIDKIKSKDQKDRGQNQKDQKDRGQNQSDQKDRGQNFSNQKDRRQQDQKILMDDEKKLRDKDGRKIVHIDNRKPIKQSVLGDCTVAKEDANKWFLIENTPEWSFQMQMKTNKQLYIRLVPSGKSRSNFPELEKLKVFLANGRIITMSLSDKQLVKGGSVSYAVVLSKNDSQLFQNQKIQGFAFGVSQKTRGGGADFNKQLTLDKNTQNKLIRMSKCLL